MNDLAFVYWLGIGVGLSFGLVVGLALRMLFEGEKR